MSGEEDGSKRYHKPIMEYKKDKGQKRSFCFPYPERLFFFEWNRTGPIALNGIQTGKKPLLMLPNGIPVVDQSRV